MDIASIVGLVGSIGVIIGAMIAGGGLMPFVDVPSILIVFGGTAMTVLYNAPMSVFLGPLWCHGESIHASCEKTG